jgi:hypothetical protein
MSQTASVRLAEIVAALSLATDLGMGQLLEFALQSCVLAMRLGEELGYSDQALREIYYQSLLRYIGCNVETHMLAAVVVTLACPAIVAIVAMSAPRSSRFEMNVWQIMG